MVGGHLFSLKTLLLVFSEFIFVCVIFRENKAWHFLWIVCKTLSFLKIIACYLHNKTVAISRQVFLLQATNMADPAKSAHMNTQIRVCIICTGAARPRHYLCERTSDCSSIQMFCMFIMFFSDILDCIKSCFLYITDCVKSWCWWTYIQVFAQ